MPSRAGFSAILHRDSPMQPWGIRLVGGCDLNKPLVVIRTSPGSPAERWLAPGDELLQIAEYDTRDVRHEDAQQLFKSAGNTIRLVVHREGRPMTPSSSRASSVDPLGLPRSGAFDKVDPIGPTSLNSAILEQGPSRAEQVVSPYKQEIDDEIHALAEQPYRTTPLVLPGAKVNRDAAPTESYLRHHPNPMFRQAPPHPLLPQDIMKIKVADTLQKMEDELGPGIQVVHKQFNSPIGLYSEQNIVDTINAHSGVTLPTNPSPTLPRSNSKLSGKKTVVYDPSKSETFKALQNEALGDNVQEVVPIQPKVFTPIKKAAPLQVRSVPHPVPGPHSLHVNSIGGNDEIQQSHTFKRLMHMVQNEGAY